MPGSPLPSFESIRPLHPILTMELVFPTALTCWAKQPWRWHISGYPVRACHMPHVYVFLPQKPELEGTGALIFDCVLPPHGVRVRPWDPGMQRLGGFRSPDAARDTWLLQVLWERAAGYLGPPQGKDQSTRSCFVSSEPTCRRKHNGERPHNVPASTRV